MSRLNVIMKFNILLLIHHITLVLAVDLYVSTSGSNKNSGGQTDPFQSPGKVQQVVRTLVSGSLDEDVTIHIADGVYGLTSSLVFTTADSGTNGHTIYWNADGTRAIVSGGIKVTSWTQGSSGMYSASVPSGTNSRNLFVGGKASNYAQRKIANRKDFTYISNGITWTNGQYDWVQTNIRYCGC